MPRDVDQSGKRRIIGLKNINRNLPLLSNQNWDLQYHRCPIRTEIDHSCPIRTEICHCCPIRTEICHCCPIRTQIYHFCPIEIRDSPASKQTVNRWGHRFNIIYKWNINLNYLIKTKSFPVRGGGNQKEISKWPIRIETLRIGPIKMLLCVNQSFGYGPIRRKFFLAWTNQTKDLSSMDQSD